MSVTCHAVSLGLILSLCQSTLISATDQFFSVVLVVSKLVHLNDEKKKARLIVKFSFSPSLRNDDMHRLVQLTQGYKTVVVNLITLLTSN